VISTPQILLDALGHAFVKLREISLLVFDEAHHACGNDPSNRIMRDFYHPFKTTSSSGLPHVLGLTASPMNKDKLELIKQLERNLHAVCRSPTVTLEEYRKYADCPQLVRLEYEAREGKSELLDALNIIIEDYDIKQDPEYKAWLKNEALRGQKNFEENQQRNTTSLLKQLKKLANHAKHMNQCLGSWMADCYISTCVNAALKRHSDIDQWMFTSGVETLAHMHQTLSPLRDAEVSHFSPSGSHAISDKVNRLVDYLDKSLSPGSACMVFVERRSVAWALKELLDRSDISSRFKAFAFVGATSTPREELADLADTRLQDEHFAEFRTGKCDICICTQVGEEGLDVQACDLVICFDHPPSVRSFIQRRGRARRAKSRFVILQDSTNDDLKYSKWKDLEIALKADYESRRRTLEELEAVERGKEQSECEYRVPSTGARLSISDGYQHLRRFCDKLPRGDHPDNDYSPVYFFKGSHNKDLTCQVILPASLPPEVQVASSQYQWRTERMARNDAAYQAYVALHKAGLVDDNLMPPAIHKSSPTTVHAEHDSLQTVEAAFDPWQATRNALKELRPVFTHRLVISDSNVRMGTLQILLPTPLAQRITTELRLTKTSKVVADVYAANCDPLQIDHYLAARSTKFLLNSVLGRRLHGLADVSLPYYVVPEMPIANLEAWLKIAEQRRPLSATSMSSREEITLIISNEPVPYFWNAESLSALQRDDEKITIRATRLSRRLDFINALVAEPQPQPKEFKMKDCVALGLTPDLVRSVAFLPSVMHNVSIALRAQQACDTILQLDRRYRDPSLVTRALTAPGATHFDYQRLEYYGDVLLKYYMRAHLFCHNPAATEGQLTAMYDELVQNSRLMQSTLDLGLHKYMSTERFKAHLWTLSKAESSSETRQISSKALADVIEALIGASFIEGKGRGEDQLLDALGLYLPEISWQSPAQLISRLTIKHGSKDISDNLLLVEGMLDYVFKRKSLLAEALTHPNAQNGHRELRSYDRLEFLGDAIIDLLVKETLFESFHVFDEGEMHDRQICLVNQDIFAYLCTETGVDVTENLVTFDARTRTRVIREVVKRKCLHDFVSRGIVSENEVQHRHMFFQTYGNLRDEIDFALRKGKKYPWTNLRALNSPKWYSDIIESLTAAVYVDSGASLDACRNVLARLGLMKIVYRAANDKDWDIYQPSRKLKEMNNGIRFNLKKFKGGRCGCRIKLGGRVLAVVMDCACEAEAESRAAEEVLKKIEEGVIDIRTKKQKRKEELQLQNGALDEERSDHEIEGLAEESKKRKREEDVMDIDE
jgi:dsRNA-specific ribonuclease/ERCC4-related helicase